MCCNSLRNSGRPIFEFYNPLFNGSITSSFLSLTFYKFLCILGFSTKFLQLGSSPFLSIFQFPYSLCPLLLHPPNDASSSFSLSHYSAIKLNISAAYVTTSITATLHLCNLTNSVNYLSKYPCIKKYQVLSLSYTS